MTDRVLFGTNWYLDTVNQAKRFESATLPRLSKVKDRFLAAGSWMALGIPGEIEELTMPFTLKGSHEDVRALFGNEPGDWTTGYYYERLRDIMTGADLGRVVTVKGLIDEVQPPRASGRKAEGTSYTFGTIVSYKDVVNGVVVHGFDFDTNSLIMNGKDYSTAKNQLIAR